MQHLVLIYIGFRSHLSGVQDPRDAADQVDTVRFVKVYRLVIRIQGMQAILLINLRQLITALISEIQIYEEKQPNGQWLKSITFKLPIIDEDLNISLDYSDRKSVV